MNYGTNPTRLSARNVRSGVLARPIRSALIVLGAALIAGLMAGERSLVADDETFWAFQPPVAPPVPAVTDAAWVKTPIDAFILARLEQEGLAPTPEADRITLIRRLSFDLTGLPPTPDEVDAFVNDAGADAYAKLVERLLASPHYGERWAQHWLDVARYADSDGFEYDDPRPNAWRYRDWVIQSFNRDRPYDEFVRLQIAGDELEPSNHDALAATGFNRLGPLRLNAGNQDEEKNRQEVLVEMTDAVGSTFLGLTMGCARCHDHKFDPIPQADYYRLQAFFAATEGKDLSLASPTEQAAYEQSVEQWKGELRRLRRKLSDINRSCRERLVEEKKSSLSQEMKDVLATPEAERSAPQRELAASAAKLLAVDREEVEQALTEGERQAKTELQSKMEGMRQQEPAPLDAVWAVADTGELPPPTYILVRGETSRHGAVVEPRFPSAAASDTALGVPADGGAAAARPAGNASTGRRAALARWLGSQENPLAARVMVNRLWQHHFGRGLVTTPNDFGLMGDPPTHPELLDWLASELMARGWSLKAMHRLMVSSAVYRQASRAGGAGLKVDPDNKLLWHMRRGRLDAEAARDSILAVTGSLNPKAGGPGVYLPLSEEVAGLVYKGSWTPTPDSAEHARRSIYLFVKRNLPDPFLEAFDAPGTMVSCAVRPVSTHAGQALALLNSPFLDEQSRVFARRLLLEVRSSHPEPNSPDAVAWMVERAYRLALARRPKAEEARLAKQFLEAQTQYLKEQATEHDAVSAGSNPPEGADPYFAAALTDYSLVVLNLDEFLFVD